MAHLTAFAKILEVERPVGRTELYITDELFLCGTGAEITPVRSVDRRVIGDGGVGEVTGRLTDQFVALVRAACRPAASG